MNRIISRIDLVFASSFLLLISGCASERVSGDTATYTYSWGVAILAAVGSLALAIFGVRVMLEERQFGKKLIGFVMVAVGLLLLLGFTPRVFFTYVTVDASHVEGDDRALWFLADPKKQFNIPLSDVVSLEERSRMERGGKRMKSVKYLVFHRSSGGETELLLTSLLSAARPRIEEGLKARKVAAPVARPERPAPTVPIASSPPEVVPAQPSPPATAGTDSVAATKPQSAPPPGRRAADAPDVSPEEAIGDDTSLKVGMSLEAHWGSKWWPAQVVQVMSDGQVKIHYDGWNDSNDEVLPRTRLRLAKGGTTSTKRSSSASGTTGGKSTGNVTAATVLNKGQRLETKWGSKWWDSQVIDVLPNGSVKVHYEGWGDSSDEVVARDRLRLPDANK